MQSPADKLRELTLAMLDVARPAYSLRAEVLEIKSILQEASGFSSDESDGIAAGETITERGVAISPTMAAMCLDDFARTVAFIRGTHDAIRDLRKRIECPVHVLYAGCGPLAPLAIPLMTVLGEDTVKFTLIDIHDESIESVMTIIDKLGLKGNVNAFRAIDAFGFSVETGGEPDAMVVEIMRAGLEAEPQVAISQHLVRSFPSAVLIPERITVDLVLEAPVANETDFDRESVLVDRVLTLDRSSIETPTDDNALGSAIAIALPEFEKARLKLMLYTTVEIYGEHVLRDRDAGITMPRRIRIEADPGDVLTFRYQIDERPGLEIGRVPSCNA